MRLPTLFLAHGSPMNALGGNPHTDAIANLQGLLPRPRAVLVVSAHWRTRGPQVSATAQPRMIFDFDGFSPELQKIRWEPPGAPEVAGRVCELVGGAALDHEQGHDHGTWSVLRHLYPQADVPTIQLGISRRATLEKHWHIALSLSCLRDEGVLMVGSGNLTHHLGTLDWGESPQTPAWAVRVDEWLADAAERRDVAALTKLEGIDAGLFRKAHPTLEHYIPFLYALAPAAADMTTRWISKGFDLGTLSMRQGLFGTVD